MKLLYLPVTLASLIIMLAFPQSILASEMTVSASPAYSDQTKNFLPLQTIYVKVEANNNGDARKELNVRNSDYSLNSTYQMSKSQNTFTANIPAPQEPAYYSLEAKIESQGSKTTTVKTIKVGNPKSSNIKVDVKSETSSNDTRDEQTETKITSEQKPTASPQQSPAQSQERVEKEENTKNIFISIKDKIESIINLIKVIF